MIWSIVHIDNGHVTCLILLDLSSACDTIDHQILLSILNRHFNITGTALTWFQTYLSNCTNLFCYGDDTTVDYILNCSVPQSSVLGPQQFSSYTTSDIPSVCMRHTVRFHLYDDDKQAYASGRVSDVDNIRRVRERHCSLVLVSSRLLQLNSAKTEAIWFRSHANLSKLTTCDLSVTVNNDNFSPAHSVRDLGVILDDETEHEAACQQPSENLLLSSSPSTPGLPSSWIWCHSATCARSSHVAHWLLQRRACCMVSQLRLVRVQKAVARLVLQLGPRDHVTSALQQLHWLSISQRITI